jgi:hypothetical protein
LEEECLTEKVQTSSKWKNSLARFKDLKEKIVHAIQEKLEFDFKITKMILKCTYRLLHDTTTFKVEDLNSFEPYQIMKM